MYKKIFSLVCLIIAGSASLYVFSTLQGLHKVNNLQVPTEGNFNKVRTVCLPQAQSLQGAAYEMRAMGADQTFNHTNRDGNYYCYSRFFNNPNKKPKAQIKYGGRSLAQEECDYRFGSLRQSVGCITFYDKAKTKFKNKITNLQTRAKKAFYANNLQEALQYLKASGE